VLACNRTTSDPITYILKKPRPSKPKASKRCDLMRSPLNGRKAQVVHEIIDRHRRGAPIVASDQWRRLFETGAIDKYAKHPDGLRLKNIVGSSARVQMLTRSVHGHLQSWLSNRRNRFREIVEASTLDSQTRHQLHTINIQQAWFTRLPVCVHGSTQAISRDVRRLARSIMHSIMSRHRRPSWGCLSVQLDQREMTLAKARTATQNGRVEYWADIRAPNIGRAVVPLLGTPPHRARKGTVALTIQINRDRNGVLSFGIVTDVTEELIASRAGYKPKTEVVSLDFGLTRLFATDTGDLIGRGFMRRLISLDHTLTTLFKHVQRSGLKPRNSRRYLAQVKRIRGFITTEVNRVLNRLVHTHAPSELILESLDFRSSKLSARMNRLLSNCGRSVVKDKLINLEERFYITATEVDPAYTSQRCSSCGHVHRSNRNGDRFRCGHCGHTIHADVNAARNIRQRRSLPALDEAMLHPGRDPARLHGRRRTLEILRQDFERRHGPGGSRRHGGRGPAADSHTRPLRCAWDEVRSAAKLRPNEARLENPSFGGKTVCQNN